MKFEWINLGKILEEIYNNMNFSWFILTFPLLGIQVAWSFEFCYGTLLLVRLGFTPVQTTLVWLAGPLSGLIIQPLFGMYSDILAKKTKSSRKLFIASGLLFSIVSLFSQV